MTWGLVTGPKIWVRRTLYVATGLRPPIDDRPWAIDLIRRHFLLVGACRRGLGLSVGAVGAVTLGGRNVWVMAGLLAALLVVMILGGAQFDRNPAAREKATAHVQSRDHRSLSEVVFSVSMVAFLVVLVVQAKLPAIGNALLIPVVILMIAGVLLRSRRLTKGSER